MRNLSSSRDKRIKLLMALTNVTNCLSKSLKEVKITIFLLYELVNNNEGIKKSTKIIVTTVMGIWRNFSLLCGEGSLAE